MGETREAKIARLEELKFKHDEYEKLNNKLGQELDEYENEVPVQ